MSLGQAEPLSQPADGRGTPNALQEWLSNLEHLRTQGGFEPSPCPIPSACREPAVCCFPEPGFAGGSLLLSRAWQTFLSFGRWQQGTRGTVMPKHPRVCTEGALQQLFAEIPGVS